MPEIVMVVDIVAADGKADELVEVFSRCIAATHEEPACITYALHRDSADPNHFVHIERWTSQELLDEHMAKPYVGELFAWAGTPGNLAKAPVLTATTGLGIGDPAKGSL